MLAHYYSNWILLDAGLILDPYMIFSLSVSLDPNAVTVVMLSSLLLFSCRSAENFVSLFVCYSHKYFYVNNLYDTTT